MKYAHLEKDTNKLLGWYADDIHLEIPTPNIEVEDEIWQEAININANCYENRAFIVKDFRTDKEIELQKQASFRAERNNLLNLVDIEINKAEDLGQDTTVLRVYRQALRDATKDWILPESVL